MSSLRGRAPAKINLGLRILGRRADGFHELRTVFQTISLADSLEVGFVPGPRRRVELVCDHPELGGDDNLASRAARELLSRGPWKGTVEIKLRKKIPAGAGLGGGSSDAAAALLALSRLLKPAPEPSLVWETAARLGSDVPFFLVGGRAVGVGRGEEIYPLADMPRAWLLVLAPSLRVSTVQAYQALARSRPKPLTEASTRFIINTFCAGVGAPGPFRASDVAERWSNDFEKVIFRRFPDLKKLKNRLARTGAAATMMSGSGSALFGFFDSREQAMAARDSLDGIDGEVFLAHTIARPAYGKIWKTSAAKKVR